MASGGPPQSENSQIMEESEEDISKNLLVFHYIKFYLNKKYLGFYNF